MRKRLPRFLFVVAAGVLSAAAMTLGAPAVDSNQSAQAVDWLLYASNGGIYCEGCCKAGSLCCSINAPCRVSAPETPAGGG